MQDRKSPDRPWSFLTQMGALVSFIQLWSRTGNLHGSIVLKFYFSDSNINSKIEINEAENLDFYEKF